MAGDSCDRSAGGLPGPAGDAAAAGLDCGSRGGVAGMGGDGLLIRVRQEGTDAAGVDQVSPARPTGFTRPRPFRRETDRQFYNEYIAKDHARLADELGTKRMHLSKPAIDKEEG